MAKKKVKAIKPEAKKEAMPMTIPESVEGGIFSNFAYIYHSENEFTFDFIYVEPKPKKAKVQARIIVTPSQAKALLNALKRNIKMYEEKFSQKIKASIKKGKLIGFKK